MSEDQKVSILLVDDRSENLSALEAVLGELGQNLVKACSGREALKRLLNEEFALILLDVQMPEMDGFETASLIRAREKTQHTPIVFLTAIYTSETHVARGYAVGAVDYVVKPFEPDLLKAKVSAFVDLAKKTQELQQEVERRQQAEEEVRRLNEELEHRVAERTAALETANRELEEADRRKDEFLAMLAHELRNPLAALANASYLLDQVEAKEPLTTRHRAVIARQIRHLTRLVDDLMDVSRITRGRIELQKEPVDLDDVVERALESIRPLLEARGHSLTVSLPPTPVRLEADPTRLEQVLANLLNNAAKYTEPGGRVTLAVEPAESHVVIRVQDTGIGIPPEVLPRIFDLFTQVDRSLDRAQGGLGIGLTLVRRLVELHGGGVAAASAGPGQGSEFEVRLPVKEALGAGRWALGGKEQGRGSGGVPNVPSSSAPSAQCPAPSLETQRPAKRVLVVEDNPDAAQMLAELLRQEGHDVRMAHDGPEALRIASGFDAELVLLDIGLPGMDGYEVARQLRQQPGLAGARLVALTGYGQDTDRDRSRDAGFDDHLTKPVPPTELQRLLTSLGG